MNFFITLLIVGLFQLTVLSFASNPQEVPTEKQIKNYKGEIERISNLTNETEQFESFEKLLKRIAPFNTLFDDSPDIHQIINYLERDRNYQNLMEKRVKDKLNFELEEIKKNQTEKFFPEFLEVFELYYKLMTGPLKFSILIPMEDDEKKQIIYHFETIKNETKKLMEKKIQPNYSNLTCDGNKKDLLIVLKSIPEFYNQFDLIDKIYNLLHVDLIDKIYSVLHVSKRFKNKLRKEAPKFVDYYVSFEKRMNEIYYNNLIYIRFSDFNAFLGDYREIIDKYLKEFIENYQLEDHVEEYEEGIFCGKEIKVEISIPKALETKKVEMSSSVNSPPQTNERLKKLETKFNELAEEIKKDKKTFAEFKAKINQRLNKIKAKTNQRLKKLEAKTNQRLKKLEAKPNDDSKEFAVS